LSKVIVYIFILIAVSSTVFPGCAKEDETLTNPTGDQSPFVGHYKFQLTGEYIGQTEMDVSNSGDFDFNVSINNSGSSLSANITGNILKNGIASGIIKNDTTKIGTFTGQLYSGEGMGYYSTPKGSAIWKMNYLY
jgi:hypothetical protein